MNTVDFTIVPHGTRDDLSIPDDLDCSIADYRSASRENRIKPHYIQRDFELDELYESFEDNLIVADDKSSNSFIMPCTFFTKDFIKTYSGDIRRCAENVDRYFMIPADIDGGMTIDEARAKYSKYSYILYSSFNHLKDGETHKFRILFLMKESVTSDQWFSRKDSLQEFLVGGDVSFTARSRGFYMPIVPRERADLFELEINHGVAVDVLAMNKRVEPVYVRNNTFKPMTSADMTEVKELLSNSSIGTYDRWWQMVYAMKQAGFDEMDVLEVSANNPNHISSSTGIKDAGLCTRTFNTCRGMGDDRSMGLLVNIIREGGHPDFRKAKSITAKKINTIEEQLKAISDKKTEMRKRRSIKDRIKTKTEEV